MIFYVIIIKINKFFINGIFKSKKRFTSINIYTIQWWEFKLLQLCMILQFLIYYYYNNVFHNILKYIYVNLFNNLSRLIHFKFIKLFSDRYVIFLKKIIVKYFQKNLQNKVKS